jgi:hypothetical protein
MINLYSDSIVAYTPVENRECQRNIHLDWICGLLIIHMIGGHIAQFMHERYILDSVFFFFMPWFFFKSGMFHKIKKEDVIIIKSAKRLLIPFIVFSLIGELFLMFKLIGLERYTLSEFGIRVFKYAIYNGICEGNLPLWFLLTLFMDKICFNLLQLKQISHVSIIIGSFLVAIFLRYLKINFPPYCISFFTGLFFYSMGFYLKNFQYSRWLFFLSILAVLSITLFMPTFINMRDSTVRYGNFVIWFPYALSGIIVINNLVKNIPYLLNISLIIKIGQNSMPIYVTHWIILSIVEIVLMLIGVQSRSVFMWVMIFACIIVLPLLTYFINRYCKSVVGV